MERVAHPTRSFPQLFSRQRGHATPCGGVTGEEGGKQSPSHALGLRVFGVPEDAFGGGQGGNAGGRERKGERVGGALYLLLLFFFFFFRARVTLVVWCRPREPCDDDDGGGDGEEEAARGELGVKD